MSDLDIAIKHLQNYMDELRTSGQICDAHGMSIYLSSEAIGIEKTLDFLKDLTVKLKEKRKKNK